MTNLQEYDLKILERKLEEERENVQFLMKKKELLMRIGANKKMQRNLENEISEVMVENDRIERDWEEI